MDDTNKCERHPEETVVAHCMHCNRGICRTCLRQYGYFCSEDCKEKTKQETENLAKPEEKQEFAILEQRVNLWTKAILWIILPCSVLLLSLIIAFKVTSKAGKVMWEFRPAEDKPFSNLTSHKGNIFVGCDDGMLYALDKQQGTVRWKFELPQADPHQSSGSGYPEQSKLCSYRMEAIFGSQCAIAKPVILRDNICITWDRNTIYAVDAEKGTLLWKRTPAGEIAGGPITGKTAIYYISNFYRELTREELKNQDKNLFRDGLFSFSGSSNTVRIKTAASVYALDCADGHDIWEKALNKHAAPSHFIIQEFQSPSPNLLPNGERNKVRGELVSHGEILYLSMYGQEDDKKSMVPKWECTLLAIDAESGKGKWKAKPTSGSLSGIYPGENGVLLVSKENFYFISPEGKEIWQQNREESSLWQPITAEDKVYFKEGKNKLTCLELTTGKRIWTAETASLTSNPVIAEELVFLPGFIEKPPEKGKKQVKMPQPKVPGLDADFLKQFDIQPGAKMVPMLYALDAKTGKTVWTKENIGGEILYHGEKIFVIKSSTLFAFLDQKIDTSNMITAIHARKGKVLWQYAHKGIVHSTDIDENRFCFTSFSSTTHIGDMFSMKPKKPADNVIYAISIGR